MSQSTRTPAAPAHASGYAAMRLVRVVVENFRSLARVDLAIDPAVTTLVGENDCGKSAGLDAIGRLLDPRESGGAAARPCIRTEDVGDAGTVAPGRESDARITLAFELKAAQIPPTGGAWETIRRVCSAIPPVDGVSTLAVRVIASRPGGATGATPRLSCEVLSAPEAPVSAGDPWDVLGALRTVCPAVRVRLMRPSVGASGSASGPSARARVLEIYRRLSAGRTGGFVSDDAVRGAISDAMGLVAASAWTSDQGAPMNRAIRDLVAVPQVLNTTLASAADCAADRTTESEWPDVRLFTMMILVGALLDAAEGLALAEGSSPLLLFDDLGDQLHPTWLASVGSMVTRLPAQMVITTHSAEMLARVALTSVRRIVRREREIDVFTVGRRLRSLDDQRRVSYHIRLRSPGALLARCWLLVEGETEAWIVPELATLLGVEFPVEGVRCVEFAQAGVAPMVKVADDLGIAWRLLSDGDEAGKHYAAAAEIWSGTEESRGGVVCLKAPDIEHFLFMNGFEHVYRDAAKVRGGRSDARHVIRTAIKKSSKPAMALAILQDANERGPSSVPPALAELVRTLAALARGTR